MKLFRIEQVIVYVLAMSGHGMTAADIANYINDEHLYIRKDGEPVSDRQVYAVVCKFNQIFVHRSLLRDKYRLGQTINVKIININILRINTF